MTSSNPIVFIPFPAATQCALLPAAERSLLTRRVPGHNRGHAVLGRNLLGGGEHSRQAAMSPPRRLVADETLVASCLRPARDKECYQLYRAHRKGAAQH